MNVKNLWKHYIFPVLFFLLLVLICYPVFFLFVGSLKSKSELIQDLGPVLLGKKGYISWSLLPQEPTLRSYVELLLDSPKFFVMFWNSAKITVGILLGQVIISIPAAWAFARYRFRFSKALYMLYIVLMILPFQVLMLSSYLVLGRFQLLDTLGAVIVPGIFSTFAIFIIHHSFVSIPESLLDAARLDGASEIRLFCEIGIPLGKPGIMSAFVLGFIEYWNIIEQPLIFLKDKMKWPLSLFLPTIKPEQVGLAFVASMVTLLPAMLVFLIGRDYLEEGIATVALKE